MKSNQGLSSEQKHELRKEDIPLFESDLKYYHESKNKSDMYGSALDRYLWGIIADVSSNRNAGKIKEAQQSEDYIIYLFRNKFIDWDTPTSESRVLFQAVKAGAVNLVDELLQSIKLRNKDLLQSLKEKNKRVQSITFSPNSIEMLDLLTKKYGFKVDIDLVRKKDFVGSIREDLEFWPEGLLTILQSNALQGNTDAVLKLLEEFKADPNVSAAPSIRMRGAGYKETVLTKMMIKIIQAEEAGETYPEDLLKKQIHIVKTLAAYGLEVTEYDKHYIRIIQGHTQTENGEDYDDSGILPKTFSPPDESQKYLSNIFEQMMEAYNEGRKIYIEQNRRDASLTVPNLGLIDVHELFRGGTPGVTNIINEYAADSDPNVIAAKAEMDAKKTYDRKEIVKAKKKDKVEKINRDAMLEGKMPDLSEVSSLFSGGSSPLTSIIKDYDQSNRTDQLTRDFGKDEKKGEKKGADVKDKEEENLDKDKGKGQQP